MVLNAVKLLRWYAFFFLIVIFSCIFLQNSFVDQKELQKSRLIFRTGSEVATSTRPPLDLPLSHGAVLATAAPRQADTLTWEIPYTDFQGIFKNSPLLQANVLLDLETQKAFGRAPSLEVFINNRRIQTLRATLPQAKDAYLAAAKTWLVPLKSAVKLATLTTTPMLVLPLRANDLQPGDVGVVRLVLKDCQVQVRRVGIGFVFDPHPISPWNKAGFIVPLAALELLVFLGIVVEIGRRLTKDAGPWAVLVMLAFLPCALLTHDGWDFSLWTHFIDMVVLGGQSPASAWSATALWSYLVVIVSPLAALAPLLHLSLSTTELLAVKLLMYTAFLAIGYFFVAIAPGRSRRVLVIMLPFMSYMVAFGTRDVVAAAFIVSAVFSLQKRRVWLAALLLACGASVDEYFFPLLALPYLFEIGLAVDKRKALVMSLKYPAFSSALFLAQWITAAAATRSHAVHSRLAQPDAGANWQKVLALQNVWPGAESFAFTMVCYAAFVLLALLVVMRGIVVLSKTTFSFERALHVALQYSVPIVGMFFLAYRGFDPQEWVGVGVLFPLYAALTESSLLPSAALLLFAFMTIYEFTGFRAYIAPEFGSPALLTLFDSDAGILNALVLGTITLIALNTLKILCSINLVSKWSTYWLLWFFAALTSFIVQDVPLDLAVWACVLIFVAPASLLDDSNEMVSERRLAVLDYFFPAVFLLLTMWSPMHFHGWKTIGFGCAGAVLAFRQSGAFHIPRINLSARFEKQA